MKVIIFSAGVGSGHDQAATAIKESLMEKQPDCQIKQFDVIKTISPFLSKVVLESYLAMLRHVPNIWGHIHDQLAENSNFHALNLTNRLLARELMDHIEQMMPDIIVCTHPFASNLIGGLRKRQLISCPVVTICTDYNIHAFWFHEGIDRYYVASPFFFPFVADLGIAKSKVRAFGIPIRKQFKDVAPVPIEKLRQQLHIKNSPVLLFIGGGLGLGDITDILTAADNAFRFAHFQVICGQNQLLYQRLSQQRFCNSLSLHQYVNNIAELMQASDIVVTKPGGVTTTEALCLKKPLALISPIPGQETRNERFLLNQGVAITVPTNSYAGHVIRSFVQQTERINAIKKFTSNIVNIDASDKIIADWSSLIPTQLPSN